MADVFERIGVSAHSLYKWVEAVKPDKSEKQTSELLEAKSEILRMHESLGSTIPKKVQLTLSAASTAVSYIDVTLYFCYVACL